MPQAARVTGLTYRLVSFWARSGLIVPSAQPPRGRGRWRLYSFEDLVALKVAARLYKAGIPTVRLRRIVRQLPQREKLAHPLAHHRLVIAGDDVLLVEGDKTAWSLVRKPGQGVFGFVLDLPALTREIRAAMRLASSAAPSIRRRRTA